MAVARLILHNTLDLYRHPTDPDEQERYRLVEALLRGLDADIVVALELGSPTPEEGERAVSESALRLAAAIGRSCQLPDGTVTALAGSQGILGLGLMWNPDAVTPAPGTWFGVRSNLWHGVCGLTFDCGGHQLTAASYHAAPNVGRPWLVANADRRAEAERVTKLLDEQAGPTLLAGDFNATAARGAYDPVPVGDDRGADGVFAEHGWLDAAVELGVPWEPTAGYRSDRYGLRRLDRVLVNREAARCLAGYSVDASPQADQASDHRPVAVRLRRPGVPNLG